MKNQRNIWQEIWRDLYSIYPVVCLRGEDLKKIYNRYMRCLLFTKHSSSSSVVLKSAACAGDVRLLSTYAVYYVNSSAASCSVSFGEYLIWQSSLQIAVSDETHLVLLHSQVSMTWMIAARKFGVLTITEPFIVRVHHLSISHLLDRPISLTH